MTFVLFIKKTANFEAFKFYKSKTKISWEFYL
jgi:hypothetical protein